jgi:large subunit ribosomal protein L13
LRWGTIQAVQAGAGVGVDGPQIGVFGAQMLEDGNQYRVLEHVGMVACVISVAVTEHAPMVTAGAVATAPAGADVACGPSKNTSNGHRHRRHRSGFARSWAAAGAVCQGGVGFLYNGGLSQRFEAPRRNIPYHLRGSRQKNADRGKGPAKPFLSRKTMSTFSAKPADVKHEWFVIDATDKVLGRIASEAALRLRGKHKAIYTPHVDTGDFIVVINASKIRVTGNKALDKVYYRHSGYPGGIYGTNFRDMQAKHPGRALEKAVKGMLPKGPLGYAMIKKLKVYGGAEHPHSAQQPKPLDI